MSTQSILWQEQQNANECLLHSDAPPATTAAAATLPSHDPVAKQVAALLAVAGDALHHVAASKAHGTIHDLSIARLLLCLLL